MITDESLKAKISILAEAHVYSYTDFYNQFAKCDRGVYEYLSLIYNFDFELKVIKEEFLSRELTDKEKYEAKKLFITAVLDSYRQEEVHQNYK